MYCVLTGNCVLFPECILYVAVTAFCVIEQMYFVWLSKCILCDWATVFCAMQQMYFVLTGNWCIVPRMPLTAVFGRQPHSSGGKRKRSGTVPGPGKRKGRTSRECTRGWGSDHDDCFHKNANGEVIVRTRSSNPTLCYQIHPRNSFLKGFLICPLLPSCFTSLVSFCEGAEERERGRMEKRLFGSFN